MVHTMFAFVMMMNVVLMTMEKFAKIKDQLKQFVLNAKTMMTAMLVKSATTMFAHAMIKNAKMTLIIH